MRGNPSALFEFIPDNVDEAAIRVTPERGTFARQVQARYTARWKRMIREAMEIHEGVKRLQAEKEKTHELPLDVYWRTRVAEQKLRELSVTLSRKLSQEERDRAGEEALEILEDTRQRLDYMNGLDLQPPEPQDSLTRRVAETPGLTPVQAERIVDAVSGAAVSLSAAFKEVVGAPPTPEQAEDLEGIQDLIDGADVDMTVNDIVDEFANPLYESDSEWSPKADSDYAPHDSPLPYGGTPLGVPLLRLLAAGGGCVTTMLR